MQRVNVLRYVIFATEPVLEFSDIEYHVAESDGYARATITRSGR